MDRNSHNWGNLATGTYGVVPQGEEARMGTVVQFVRARQVEVAQTPEEDLPPGSVRVRTLYSGISAGTEFTTYRGTNPYASEAGEE